MRIEVEVSECPVATLPDQETISDAISKYQTLEEQWLSAKLRLDDALHLGINRYQETYDEELVNTVQNYQKQMNDLTRDWGLIVGGSKMALRAGTLDVRYATENPHLESAVFVFITRSELGIVDGNQYRILAKGQSQLLDLPSRD